MALRGVRKFTTTALRAAELAQRVEAANAYGVQVSKAQKHVDGFVGGKKYLGACDKAEMLIR